MISPKEITWSSLSVATGDVQESLETAVQYTAMAQGLREKGLISRAIRMMERALMITQRSELEHPTLALAPRWLGGLNQLASRAPEDGRANELHQGHGYLQVAKIATTFQKTNAEACKVRLVFAAYLSEGYRHREALRIIKEAQESLTRLMHWAVQCPEDMAVQDWSIVRAVGREARALHCSAVVAQAVASDLSEDPEEMDENLKDSDDWETQTRKKLSEVHKQAKFQLELVNVDELKEKRYTRAGHKVFMQNMRKTNKSWSDPDISREARKDKLAPEVCQLKKLSRKIYVKPPVQAPPPPPPKPKMDHALAGSMKESVRQRTEEPRA
ncbi:unnamed protein product [Effrenium voratum]|nr:unnamed protein product [Effrenium voratum]